MSVQTIQVLRFLAATAVVLTHCSFGHFFIGIAGVDIFFVISGFIIAGVMQKRGASLFMLDRATRIYPIFWLCLLPMAILHWDGDWLRLASSITLWPLFGSFRRPFLDVGWTLYFEMLFYVGAALILWQRRLAFLLAIGWATCLMAPSAWRNPVIDFLGNSMIVEFALGVAIARLPRTTSVAAGGAAMIMGVVGLIYFADSSFGSIENIFAPNLRGWLWGVPAALIVWGALQFEGRLRGRVWDMLVKGGDASYSIYLMHPLVLLLGPRNIYVFAASMPPLSIAVGVLVRRFVEVPLLTATRRVVMPRRPSSTDASQLASPVIP